MTAPASPSASPTAAPRAPQWGRLRPAALAVTVVAAVDALITLGHSLLLLFPQRPEAAEYAIQVSEFIAVVVSTLLAVCVVLLVQRATRPDGRTMVPALLVLSLLTFTLLLDPLWAAVSNLLVASGPMGGSSPLIQLLSLGTNGLDVLCTLALGLLALLLAVRAGTAPRNVPAPGRPRSLAAGLCVLAVVAVVLLPVHLVTARFLVADSPLLLLLATVPGTLMGVAHALLVPVCALLIAQTTGAPRRLTWIVLAALWLSAIATNLFIRLLMVQLELGASPEVFGLWNGLSSAVQVITALTILVLAVVVLVQVRRSAPGPAPTGTAPTGTTP